MTETVYIVDDDASVRDSLSLLLSLRGHATASFASAEDFLSAYRPDWRGCLVVDIRMSGMSGLELQAELVARRVSLPVIVVTAHGSVAAARQAFLAQAVDFLEKPFGADALLQAVTHALEGLPAAEPAARPKAGLTAREAEVLELLVQGLHNRRIAEALGISPRTVEVHKARVLEKHGVGSVVELVRRIERAR